MNWEMLAKPKPIYPGTPLAKRILESPLWVAQLKVDGMRVMVDIQRSKTIITSKHGKITQPPSKSVLDAINSIPALTLLDCEMDSQSEQLWIFDLLVVASQNITHRPLSERLMRLNSVVQENKHIKLVPTVRERKEDYYNAVIEAGGEGIVLKRLSDPYPKGGVVWLKLKPVRN
jgi:bifunctional non-homologous end joining protein LigD